MRFSEESADAWRALIALGLLFFLITAGTFTSLGVVLPAMVRDLGWDWVQAGFGFTLLGLATGLASYAPTFAIRLAGVRFTLISGAAILVAGFLCFYAARGVELYWLGATLAGVGFALTAIIPGTYVLARAFRARSTAIGIYFTLGGLGGVAGPWLYLGVEAASGDWRAYWLAMAAAVGAAGLFAAGAATRAATAGVVPVEAPVEVVPNQVFRTRSEWDIRQALGAPQFWVIVAAYTTYLLCGVTVNALSVQHLTERGASAALAGGMLSFQALVNTSARAAGGLLGERIDPRRLVVFALACLVAGVSALALADSLALMLLYALGVGVGYGLSYLATTVLLLNYFGRERNLELFSTMCLISTLASAGPILGGLAHDRLGGFEPAFWGFAALAGLVMIAVAAMRPPEPERR